MNGGKSGFNQHDEDMGITPCSVVIATEWTHFIPNADNIGINNIYNLILPRNIEVSNEPELFYYDFNVLFIFRIHPLLILHVLDKLVQRQGWRRNLQHAECDLIVKLIKNLCSMWVYSGVAERFVNCRQGI